MTKTKELPQLEVYWTTKQVAERLHKSEECIKKWLASGRLKKTKAGNGTLVTETDLQAFLAESTRKRAA